jgi:hypothetical protein
MRGHELVGFPDATCSAQSGCGRVREGIAVRLPYIGGYSSLHGASGVASSAWLHMRTAISRPEDDPSSCLVLNSVTPTQGSLLAIEYPPHFSVVC